MFAAAVLIGGALLAQQGSGPGPAFVVRNDSNCDRHEVVTAALPVPLAALKTDGVVHLRAWFGDDESPTVLPATPLMRWHDGSVSLLQVHARVRVPAGGSMKARLELPQVGRLAPRPRAVGPTSFPFDQALPLALYTEVEDPWRRLYRARLEPDPTAGPGGILRETELVVVRRFRSTHRRVVDDGEGEPTADSGETFLGLRAYLETFAGERRAVLTVVLDNVDLACGPLGPVRLRAFRMITTDDRLRFRPRFAAENGLRVPRARDGGGYHQDLLGPADGLYLGDQTAKAFRFDLFLDDDSADPAERSRVQASSGPLRPLPALDWVRLTGAFGAHGGPAPTTELESGAVGPQLERWRKTARFGPFTGFGDPEDAAVQGTARNGPSALHNAVRWSSPELLVPAEGMVLQHTLRPTPGPGPALPEDTEAFRQGLGPAARAVPHGFTALDYEHFSVNLLFDWYWLTGDPLAFDELERMGRGLRGVLAHLPFRTSRGEGWCMQSGALIARATGDRALADWLARRFRDEVLPELGGVGQTYAIAQPPHPDAMGREPFDAPWQMAALVHGLHSLYRETSDGTLASAAVDVARVMAGPGWLEGVGPKYFVSALDLTRYTLPVGFGPLEGTARMEIGAFVLAAELTSDPQLRRQFDARAAWILAPLSGADAALVDQLEASASPWLQIPLDRRGGLL